MIAVLDTAAFSALAPTTERQRARLRALLEQVDDLVTPAAVLAEGVLRGHAGRDHGVGALLRSVDVVPVDEELGLRAGALRQQVHAEDDRRPSGVEALVVALADERAAVTDVLIVTADIDDIESLAVFTTSTARLSTRRV